MAVIKMHSRKFLDDELNQSITDNYTHGNLSCVLDNCRFSMTPVQRGADRMATYRLRNDVYSKEYQWVNNSTDHERDFYDDFSTHYITKDSAGQIVGTMRTISHEFEWMAESSFDHRFRNSAKLLKGEGTNEASRLAISKKYRNAYISKGITLLDLMLSRLLFDNFLEGIESTYIITFAVMGKLLSRRGLHVETASEVNILPDNCRIQAFIVNTPHSIENYYPYKVLIKNHISH